MTQQASQNDLDELVALAEISLQGPTPLTQKQVSTQAAEVTYSHGVEGDQEQAEQHADEAMHEAQFTSFTDVLQASGPPQSAAGAKQSSAISQDDQQAFRILARLQDLLEADAQPSQQLLDIFKQLPDALLYPVTADWQFPQHLDSTWSLASVALDLSQSSLWDPAVQHLGHSGDYEDHVNEIYKGVFRTLLTAHEDQLLPISRIQISGNSVHPISDAQASILLRLTNQLSAYDRAARLQHLAITHSTITLQTIMRMSMSPVLRCTLRVLDLSHNPNMTWSEGMDALVYEDLLQQLSSLTYLDLSHTGLNSAGIEHIVGEVMKENRLLGLGIGPPTDRHPPPGQQQVSPDEMQHDTEEIVWPTQCYMTLRGLLGEECHLVTLKAPGLTAYQRNQLVLDSDDRFSVQDSLLVRLQPSDAVQQHVPFESRDHWPLPLGPTCVAFEAPPHPAPPTTHSTFGQSGSNYLEGLYMGRSSTVDGPNTSSGLQGNLSNSGQHGRLQYGQHTRQGFAAPRGPSAGQYRQGAGPRLGDQPPGVQRTASAKQHAGHQAYGARAGALQPRIDGMFAAANTDGQAWNTEFPDGAPLDATAAHGSEERAAIKQRQRQHHGRVPFKKRRASHPPLYGAALSGANGGNNASGQMVIDLTGDHGRVSHGGDQAGMKGLIRQQDGSKPHKRKQRKLSRDEELAGSVPKQRRRQGRQHRSGASSPGWVGNEELPMARADACDDDSDSHKADSFDDLSESDDSVAWDSQDSKAQDPRFQRQQLEAIAREIGEQPRRKPKHKHGITHSPSHARSRSRSKSRHDSPSPSPHITHSHSPSPGPSLQGLDGRLHSPSASIGGSFELQHHQHGNQKSRSTSRQRTPHITSMNSQGHDAQKDGSRQKQPHGKQDAGPGAKALSTGAKKSRRQKLAERELQDLQPFPDDWAREACPPGAHFQVDVSNMGKGKRRQAMANHPPRRSLARNSGSEWDQDADGRLGFTPPSQSYNSPNPSSDGDDDDDLGYFGRAQQEQRAKVHKAAKGSKEGAGGHADGVDEPLHRHHDAGTSSVSGSHMGGQRHGMPPSDDEQVQHGDGGWQGSQEEEDDEGGPLPRFKRHTAKKTTAALLLEGSDPTEASLMFHVQPAAAAGDDQHHAAPEGSGRQPWPRQGREERRPGDGAGMGRRGQAVVDGSKTNEALQARVADASKPLAADNSARRQGRRVTFSDDDKEMSSGSDSESQGAGNTAVTTNKSEAQQIEAELDIVEQQLQRLKDEQLNLQQDMQARLHAEHAGTDAMQVEAAVAASDDQITGMDDGPGASAAGLAAAKKSAAIIQDQLQAVQSKLAAVTRQRRVLKERHRLIAFSYDKKGQGGKKAAFEPKQLGKRAVQKPVRYEEEFLSKKRSKRHDQHIQHPHHDIHHLHHHQQHHDRQQEHEHQQHGDVQQQLNHERQQHRLQQHGNVDGQRQKQQQSNAKASSESAGKSLGELSPLPGSGVDDSGDDAPLLIRRPTTALTSAGANKQLLVPVVSDVAAAKSSGAASDATPGTTTAGTTTAGTAAGTTPGTAGVTACTTAGTAADTTPGTTPGVTNDTGVPTALDAGHLAITAGTDAAAAAADNAVIDKTSGAPSSTGASTGPGTGAVTTPSAGLAVAAGRGAARAATVSAVDDEEQTTLVHDTGATTPAFHAIAVHPACATAVHPAQETVVHSAQESAVHNAHDTAAGPAHDAAVNPEHGIAVGSSHHRAAHLAQGTAVQCAHDKAVCTAVEAAAAQQPPPDAKQQQQAVMPSQPDLQPDMPTVALVPISTNPKEVGPAVIQPLSHAQRAPAFAMTLAAQQAALQFSTRHAAAKAGAATRQVGALQPQPGRNLPPVALCWPPGLEQCKDIHPKPASVVLPCPGMEEVAPQPVVQQAVQLKTASADLLQAPCHALVDQQTVGPNTAPVQGYDLEASLPQAEAPRPQAVSPELPAGRASRPVGPVVPPVHPLQPPAACTMLGNVQAAAAAKAGTNVCMPQEPVAAQPLLPITQQTVSLEPPTAQQLQVQGAQPAANTDMPALSTQQPVPNEPVLNTTHIAAFNTTHKAALDTAHNTGPRRSSLLPWWALPGRAATQPSQAVSQQPGDGVHEQGLEQTDEEEDIIP